MPFTRARHQEALQLNSIWRNQTVIANTLEVLPLDGRWRGELVQRISVAAIDAAARLAADSFQAVMLRWRDILVQHRCGLSKFDIDALGSVPSNWRCDDVEFVVERLSFQDAEPATAARSRAIETRLKLSGHEIEVAFQAGLQEIHRSSAIRAFAEQANAR